MTLLSVDPIEGGIADPKSYGSKPILFFDIDGVFNRIPFVEIYIGPDCDCADRDSYLGCVHGKNPLHWEIRRMELEDDLFDDIPATLEDGVLLHEDWKFRIWVSEELTQGLQDIYSSDQVDIIFLSMWQEHSRYLNGLFGTSIPHIPIPRKLTESEHGAKHRALFGFLEELNATHGSITPFGWVDDVVTASIHGVDIHTQISERLAELSIDEPPTLILNPATSEGIRRSHWQQILDFVAAHSVVSTAERA